jgi:isopentenyl-diphosphate Delta-isomerase
VEEDQLSKRKSDHINMALESRTGIPDQDFRFNYEPLLAGHPGKELSPFPFLGKKMNAPIWVSSMTGGTGEARYINQNLARACKEFGLGMGLGSCRPLLESDEFFPDFDLRKIIGDEYPFFANLGVAQVEKLLEYNQADRIVELVKRLQADGLIIHVNPMQEWLQPEGDRFKHAPLDTIKRLIDQTNLKLIVKEVGQGMGQESLKALLKLPIEAIEFGAFGGTNFALLELKRANEATKSYFEPLSKIGHNAWEMNEIINRIVGDEKDILCKQLIISGGITSFLDGYYLVRKSRLTAVYGQASTFLKHAKESYDQLHTFVVHQIEGIKLADSYLHVK